MTTAYSMHTKHNQFIPITTLRLSSKMPELVVTMATMQGFADLEVQS